MEWNSLLTDLNYRLSDLYFLPSASKAIVTKAGLNPAHIQWTGVPIDDWFNILNYARLQGLEQLLKLLEAITSPKELGERDEFLKGASKSLKENKAPVEAPHPADTNWHEPDSPDTIEKLMGSVSTLLPISFLEQGLRCSKSVVRIDTGNGLGTGLLVRGNYIVTNNHVIPDLETARKSSVQFNYQTDWKGLALATETFKLDPDSSPENFITDADPRKDYTIVKLSSDANTKYGELSFSETTVKKDDFVNIIQHPSGGPKQLALYHNIVTFADNSVVQYLTDTLPGSSGSPVFNSEWKIVALHHSGGWIKEPGIIKPVYRNEGINIRVIEDALKMIFV